MVGAFQKVCGSMINLELAHFFTKFYLVGLFICFLLSYINRHKNKSNLIAVTYALLHCVIDQFTKSLFDFYTFYLAIAFGCIMFVLCTALTHLYFRLRHMKTTVFVYAIYFSIAISCLILHRVLVVIYTSDESILWLINLQSGFALTLYFLSICTFAYGCKISWNTLFGRFSL